MFGILQGQAPAKQNVTDTISTLSGRLGSATLLEDRRAAILGLRSFAKDYPASVASEALRSLITSIRLDGHDVDTIKITLETLLALFNPSEDSPEASDDIPLWLADEFTQRQDNITILLDLLASQDFYPRLYALQILTSILAARPSRTQECVFAAPLGISRLVTVLDDRRDATRDEALLLLVALTPSSPEIQKLVAFENAFERLFQLIESEGSLAEGGIVIQDCLTLIANLVRLNASNQSFFRETNCVQKLARLVEEAARQPPDNLAQNTFSSGSRDTNIWGVLAVVRLFLNQGSPGTRANQLAFWHGGLLAHILTLGFNGQIETQIRAEAVRTCADLIRGNSSLQENFAQMRVMITQPSESRSPEPSPLVNRANEVYVIDGLLDLALKLSAPSFLDIRLAARDCLKAYFQQHQAIRHHFLRRAVEGHQSGSDETANILTTLLDPPSSSRSDPYQVWLAAVLLLAILYDDYEAKEIVRSVTQGDASTGEEVVSCVTLVSGHMLDAIGRQEDDRIPIAYLMLLCCWLWEEPDSVNDFLSEGSQLQSLLDAANGNRPDQKIVQGLCVLLLGIIYEFSTKDSVIPRADISALLLGKLGRDQYVDKLGKLREEPSLRDFEVLPQVSSNGRAGGLPEVFFEKEFVDFVRDNFSRLLRSIDREPGLEISVITNGVQKGISRELVDSLNGQLEEKTQALQKAEAEILEYERKLGQEQADHRRTREIAAAETTTVRTINAALQKQHDEELGTWREQSKREIDQLKIDHQSEREATRRHSVQSRNDNERDFQHLKVRHNNDLTELKRKLESAETELLTLRERYDAEIKAKSKEHEDRIRLLEQNAAASEREKHGVHTQLVAAKDAKKVKEAARQETQDQLDDLLMVFADLEAKRVSDKKRLKALGEEVSDFEEEEEEV